MIWGKRRHKVTKINYTLKDTQLNKSTKDIKSLLEELLWK
jgi:hypothetical protein